MSSADLQCKCRYVPRRYTPSSSDSSAWSGARSERRLRAIPSSILLANCLLKYLRARDPKRDLRAHAKNGLAFRELEPLAGALLAVLFPLALPCVPREVTELLEPGPQLRVELHQ